MNYLLVLQVFVRIPPAQFRVETKRLAVSCVFLKRLDSLGVV